MKRKILQLIEASPGGVTSRELAIDLRCPRDVVARWLGELKIDGLVCGTRHASLVTLGVTTPVCQLDLGSKPCVSPRATQRGQGGVSADRKVDGSSLDLARRG